MFFKQKRKNQESFRGFTLIEALVLLFVFSVITLAFYSLISVGTRYIIFSKNRLAATALANEKMEIIRNLAYSDVGIVGGVVNGSLPAEEEVNENGRNFKVRTSVRYVDDSFDGILGGSPDDAAFKDYKIVKVVIGWNESSPDEGEVEVVSRFVPAGLETVSAGDGVLSINIISSMESGVGVSQSSVHIENSDVGVDETLETDDTGNIMLVGASESIQRYKLTVSKDGYETAETFLPYPDTAYNPIDVHASVIAGALNMASVDLNKLGDLRISTKNCLGDPISGINFSLSGGRKLGTTVIAPIEDVFNFNESGQTDSNGEKEYENISPGGYAPSVELDSTNYELISTYPSSPVLPADGALEIKIKLSDKSTTSVAFKIKASDNEIPIEGANVRLKNDALLFDQTVTTEGDGIAFFPREGILQAGTYDLTVNADGFSEYSSGVSFIEGELVQNDIPME